LKDEIYAVAETSRSTIGFRCALAVPTCARTFGRNSVGEHPSYYDKDRLEKEVCRMVCDYGEMPAQRLR
jgi:hypothetical protein